LKTNQIEVLFELLSKKDSSGAPGQGTARPNPKGGSGQPQ
jgi:hypothetical protein